MPKKQKIKSATKRVKNTKKTTKSNFWPRVWNIICWPFRMIARACKWVWKKLCNMNVVGVANATLLIAIIVLFSILIIDFIGYSKRQTVIVRNDVVSVPVIPSDSRNVVVRPVKPVTKTLPMKVSAQTGEYVNEPINVAKVKPCKQLTKQIAHVKKENKIMGDVVIDTRRAAKVITHNTRVQGNLYLQNMRKYTLPCNVRVEGNLFLRDVNKLQFCGKFTVTGNIYVNPRSSFGPVPSNAVLGGQVIL